MDLASRDYPLNHLEQRILGGEQFKYADLFQKLLDLILANSGRKFLDTTNQENDRQVVPALVRVNKFATIDRMFVRGLKGSSNNDRFPNMGDLRDQLPC